MGYLLKRLPAFGLALLLSLIASSEAFAQATVVILNDDAPGVGFNDNTPATPVGGNNGMTVGEQRLIAFQAAANIWGASLTSAPTITIKAKWIALPCAANTGTLAAAGNSGNIWRDFSGAVPGHFYGNALANAITGRDLNDTVPNAIPGEEISAEFNINLGTPGCLQSLHWYYGLDANEGTTGVDLVAVVLHELGHGLGFGTFTNAETGQQAGNTQRLPTIFDRFLFDNSTGKSWAQMTDAERVASARNDANLVWNGPQVTADSGLLTFGKDGQGHPWMFAPITFAEGSSVSHWDNDATPNQLMEHLIMRDLSHSVRTPQDLTLSLLKDIGWPTGPPPPPPPPPPAPANDNFASAQTISGCSGTVNGTNAGATKEQGEPGHWPASPDSRKSVWYQWQASASSSVTIDTIGSNYDTILAVYTGTSVGGLTFVAANDDIEGSTASRVSFDATQGTIYRIAVDGFNNTGSGGDVGNIVLNWSQNCTVVGPTIFVEQGTNVLAAVDSVTQVKGPFTVMTSNNFSQDGRRRIIFFTTNLGLSAGNTSGLTVRANTTSLPIETAGPFSLINGSYIIVRLDNLTPGTYNLTVTLNNVSSTNAPTIQIIQ